MSFARLGDSEILELIEYFGGLEKFLVLAGAGVSVEAGLPTWVEFARRLLYAAAAEKNLFSEEVLPHLSPDEWRRRIREWREDWVRSTLQSESPQGAVTLADAFSDHGTETHLHQALYGDKPEDYIPGPIARALAELKADLGADLHLWTTNYDDLLEEALAEHPIVRAHHLAVIPYVGGPRPKEDYLLVRHMHGYCDRAGTVKGRLVVTDPQYSVLSDTEYPYDDLRSDVRAHSCLIVGASLNDPNVTRFLYRLLWQKGQKRFASEGDRFASERDHYVLFVRQAEAYEQPYEVRQARERALQARWASTGVHAIFLDHFSDVGQLLSEISHYRATKTHGGVYEPLTDRMPKIIDRLEKEVLHAKNEAGFQDRQPDLVLALRNALAAGAQAVRNAGRYLDEPLTAGLWLFDRYGRRLKLWATSERINLHPDLLQAIDLDTHRGMVAVKAACGGLGVGEPRERIESRWEFIRGLPLTLSSKRAGTLPIGVMTITASTPTASSEFAQLPRLVAERFDVAAADSLGRFIAGCLEEDLLASTAHRALDIPD
jgi:NAD-dependent SIR2 family protein deacetylase